MANIPPFPVNSSSVPVRLFASIRTVHYRLLAVFWTIGIIAAVTLPTGSIPEVQPTLSVDFDKVVHAGLFAGFGVLWLRGVCPPDSFELPSGVLQRGVLLFVAGVLFAIGTEVYQQRAVAGRTGDLYDAAADLFGLLVAFGGYYAYHGWSPARAADRPKE